jgi:hypothetical protein
VTRPTCCHGGCNQGRGCPHRAAVPPTRREWAFSIGLLVLAVLASVVLSGCDDQDQIGGDIQIVTPKAWKIVMHTDPDTGCQYLRVEAGRGLTPRTSVDGVTQMGCRRPGAQP